MSNYTLKDNSFIIEDYTNLPPFSSFLPGIAGVDGIPIWCFYCNRGQGINSFGINHKGDAIMEFNPAVTAYEDTPLKGFRSFVKVNGENFEPFCSYDRSVKRVMNIESNVLTITETGHGLEISVSYIILPRENVGALVRNVKIKNISGKTVDFEMLDGMAQIIPFGVQNGAYKEMSNLMRSWADIKNIENEAPVFAMRASGNDSAEISEIEGGYFYTALKNGKNLHIIYDKNVVFGENNSMTLPVAYLEKGYEGILATEQCFANKVPCAFACVKETIPAEDEIVFTAFAGFTSSIALLNSKTKEFAKPTYAPSKFDEARKLTDSFTKDVRTKTANPLFDKYVEQCYMDNFLRGGYPFVFRNENGKNSVVHLFSRKHGDPERDYNFFSTAGEYYSQGNGNYRDVCQNRRHDVFFNPEIGDFNVYTFYSMVQIDGYNPLEIRPSTFVIPEGKKEEAKKIIEAVAKDEKGVLLKTVSGAFTPGQITNAVAKNGIGLSCPETELVERLIALSEQRLEAGFGEGYWCDHFDYNLDLLEDYLRIFPDKKEELLFGDKKYRFYDSIAVVRPREDAYVLSHGKARQYCALMHWDDKYKNGFNGNGTNWLKDKEGNEITTTLFGKLVTLTLNKFLLLDPEQMGVEMDGGKPGWNDAMNGLPGLFGSSMPETLELKRTIDFMLRELNGKTGEIEIPEELTRLLSEIKGLLGSGLKGFDYWDAQCEIKEKFRAGVRLNLSGKNEKVTFAELADVLVKANAMLEEAVTRSLEIGNGIIPTYYTYEATDFEVLKNEDGSDRISPYGLPAVKVHAFERQAVPRFLEGPARLLAASDSSRLDENRKMAEAIKECDIYDKKLKMYKTSESIEHMSYENGRVRAFTPGWLERESIFLHMEYKYFLGLMKAGLYDEYYDAIRVALVPYLDPAVYKRSILENSSFIASSANPDKSVHGQGFVARLTGSTVEMLSMWIKMFLGNGGFSVNNGVLTFALDPILEGSMFDENGEASFILFGKTQVIYKNGSRKNTYGENGAKVIKITLFGESEKTFEGDSITGSAAEDLRAGKINRIVAELN